MPNVKRRASILAIALALLAATLVYSPGLSGDFLFDDYPNIVSNPLVHMDTLDQASVSRAFRAYQPGAYGRPLATLWFAIDHMIGGKDPFVFKLSGLLLHLLNTALVFLLVRALLTHPLVAWRKPIVAAGFIAALWSIHPLQVSSVLYVVQRMELLATTFTLLGLVLYLKARTGPQGPQVHWGMVGLSFVLAAVGLLSKETAILFPLFVLVLELAVLGFKGADGINRQLRSAHVAVLAIGSLGFALLIAPTYFSEAAYAGRDFTLWERLLSQPRALCLYLAQMVFPNPTLTTFYYDHFEPSTGLLAPWTTLISLLTLATLAGSAIVLRKAAPLFSLGIGWFFAAHALTSNVVNLELVFEHRNYLALLGIVLAAAGLLKPLASRILQPRLAIAIATMVALGLGTLTAIRSATWGDPFNLAMDLITLAPESSRAANDMATLYFGMSDGNPNSPFFQFAVYEFERSRSLPRSSIIPEQGLIVMAATAGAQVQDAWWEGLIDKVRYETHNAEMLNTLNGLLILRIGGLEIGDHQLSRAVTAFSDRSPLPLFMRFNYYLVLLESEDAAAEVLEHARAARRLGELSTTDLQQLALALAERGHESLANMILAMPEIAASGPINPT